MIKLHRRLNNSVNYYIDPCNALRHFQLFSFSIILLAGGSRTLGVSLLYLLFELLLPAKE